MKSANKAQLKPPQTGKKKSTSPLRKSKSPEKSRSELGEVKNSISGAANFESIATEPPNRNNLNDYGKYADHDTPLGLSNNGSFADNMVRKSELQSREAVQQDDLLNETSSANLLIELDQKNQALAVLQKQNTVLRLKNEINGDKDQALAAKNDLILRAEAALTQKEYIINQNNLQLEECKIEIDRRKKQVDYARTEL